MQVRVCECVCACASECASASVCAGVRPAQEPRPPRLPSAQAPGRGVRAESQPGRAARSAVEGNSLQGSAGPVAAGGRGSAPGSAGPVPAGRGQVMSPQTSSWRPFVMPLSPCSHAVGKERQATGNKWTSVFSLPSVSVSPIPALTPGQPFFCAPWL